MELFRPQPHLRRARSGTVKYIIIHSTRGTKASNDAQYRATINWFTNPNNSRDGGLWGSSADYVVGARGEVAKASVDLRVNRANWSAGWGDSQTLYPADNYGIAIEVAQRNTNTPYTPESIDALVELCRELADKYDIPPVHIKHLTQKERSIPRGYVGHEDTAHGRKTGKSDPGPLFPWDDFIRRLGTPEKTSDLEARVTRIETVLRSYGVKL